MKHGEETKSQNFNLKHIKSDETKLTFEEKIKEIKRRVYMYSDEGSSKKNKNIKFIKINPDEAKVLEFKFKYRPEYVCKGQKIIITDSTMKAIGVVTEVLYE